MAKWWQRSQKIILLDGLIVLVVLGSIGWVMYSNRKQPADFNCDRTGQRHEVTVVNDAFEPASLKIKRCDSVKITSRSKLAFNLNFGARNQHRVYPGYTAVTLLPHESTTIDAYAAGTFVLHDHFRDNAKLQLVVKE
jgi:hypothetical protein